MEVILVKKYSNVYKDGYDELFRVVSDGFEGMNPGEILKDRSLTSKEIVELAGLLDNEEEIENLKELLEKAFEEDPEAAADILGIPVYDRMPWEVYFPDEE